MAHLGLVAAASAAATTTNVSVLDSPSPKNLSTTRASAALTYISTQLLSGGSDSVNSTVTSMTLATSTDDQSSGGHSSDGHGSGGHSSGGQSSDSAQQQSSGGGEHGHQQESEADQVLDMQVVLICAITLVAVSMFFEVFKGFIEEWVPHMMGAVVAALFGELTVLGFIALFAYFCEQTGVLDKISEHVYHDEPHRVAELFEEVHFNLFFVLCVFILQTLVLVRALTSSIAYWSLINNLQRDDHWPQACQRLREAYAGRAGHGPGGFLRRTLMRPYWAVKADTLRYQVRFALLRERFVSPPPPQKQLPPLFNFAAYLRRRGAKITVHILHMPFTSWLVVGFFLIFLIEGTMLLEVIAGKEADDVEGYGIIAVSWAMFFAFLALRNRLNWMLDQCTPPFPLLAGPADDDEPAPAPAPAPPAKKSWFSRSEPEAKVPIADETVRFGRPDPRWIMAELPYEQRPLRKGVNKMESLFPMGRHGPHFLLHATRVLLFCTAIMTTIDVYWTGAHLSLHTDVLRGLLALIPLLILIFFAPRTLLPLIVVITSIEQFKAAGEIRNTVVEMKVEIAMRILKTLSVVYMQARNAMSGNNYVEHGEGEALTHGDATAAAAARDEATPSANPLGHISRTFSESSLGFLRSKEKAPTKKDAKGRDGGGDLKSHQINDLKAAFRMFDTDKSGTIDLQEFSKLLHTLGLDADRKVVRNIFLSIDKNNDGAVNFDEFCDYMVRQGFNMSEPEPEEIVDHIFEILDDDASGTVSTDEMRTMLNRLNTGLSAAEVDQAMQMFDLDGSGSVTKREFLKAVEMMNTFANVSMESALASRGHI